MKEDIKKKLLELLDNIPTYFKENELAYYSAHCKNEQQIRDRIAWQLHQYITKEYGELFVVRREWAPEGFGKKRVDLAILKMDSNKEKVENVIALIEFKAHSIARPEKYYLSEFQKDIKKMKDMKKFKSESEDEKITCKNAYLYFVFLETGQDRKAEEKCYKSVLGFSLYQKGECVYCKNEQDKSYLNAIKSHWQAFNQGKYKVEGIESIEIPEPKAICIGEAYGYKQYISPLLIGPLE